MKISVPDLRVYPVMKTLTMEVLWLGMAELKFNTTGTELFFREPKSTIVAIGTCSGGAEDQIGTRTGPETHFDRGPAGGLVSEGYCDFGR